LLDWWNSLPLMKQFFIFIAVPSTVILLIQTVMTMIGLGDSHDADSSGYGGTDSDSVDFDDASGIHDGIGLHDGSGAGNGADFHDGMNMNHDLSSHDAASAMDHDSSHHTSWDGFRFFTVRGIVAFFSIFGWTGSALVGSSNPVLTFIIAFMAGFTAMTLISLLFYAILRLQSKGNLDYRYSVGTQGDVYIPIPSQRSGMGKVNVIFQERLVEADAVTDEEEKLVTGARIRVVGLLGNNVLLVSKEWKPEKQDEAHSDQQNEAKKDLHNQTLQLP